MPMFLVYLVAFALAATVTLWFAPMSLWQKSNQPEDIPTERAAGVFKQPAVGGLQVRHEGLD